LIRSNRTEAIEVLNKAGEMINKEKKNIAIGK
jgi:hypothetical protein